MAATHRREIHQDPPQALDVDKGNIRSSDSDGEEEKILQDAGGKKRRKKKKAKKSRNSSTQQSDPPRIGLSHIFPDGIYPEGETHEYRDHNAFRTTSEEKRYLERLAQEDPETSYQSIRRAAEVHRVVRQHARRTIRPGMTMTEIVENIEAGTRALVEEDGLKRGIAFPTGVSLNECAAHYTPNAGDTRVLQTGDVLKVDIGVHVNGRIVDSAFTLNFEPTYDNLLEAVKAGTNTSVREAGIDARVGEIGAAVQEVIESYEVTVGSKTLPVRCIANLTGHTIDRYHVHGLPGRGKAVPVVKTDDDTKMEEGESFALETFGSTGRGIVRDTGTCSHYSRMFDAPVVPLRLSSSKQLLKVIDQHFNTLPFCRRYLDRLGQANYLLALNDLVSKGIVQEHPPLSDIRGSMTAQFEHTILLRPTCKEVVSRGEDY